MRRITEHGSLAPGFRSGLWERSRAAVRYLWGIYTKPTPDAAREVLALMLLCFIISLVSSGFLYNWMADTLSYGQATSAAVAGFCGPTVFLLLLLVHPARCLFTLALPTLGTKQGRKLVLSSAMMLLLLNVVPNITANVGVLSHMLKCTSESLVQGLIDFSDVMNRAKADVIGEAIKVQKAEPQFVRSLTEFHHFTHINVTEIKDRVSSVSKNIERDFSNTGRILRHIQSVANRLLAAFFVICLLFESARYLKSYLTNVKFDNTCISGTLLSMACDKGLEIPPGNMRNLNRSTSCGISRQEFLRCMPRIVAVTLYLVVTVLFIVLDYMVYHLISASKPWVLDIPPANISISVEYKVEVYIPLYCIFNENCGESSVVDFRRTYHRSLSARPERCAADLYEPHQRVVFLLGFLYLVAYSMVFLEVYAMRSRRAVASSFFKWQEEKRVAFLCQKVLAKEEKKSGIFFIKATHGVNKLE